MRTCSEWWGRLKRSSVTLPSISDIYTTRCICKATSIVEDPTQPSHRLFSLLLSGRRFHSIWSVTTRIQNSCFPQAIRLLNTQEMIWSPLFPCCMLSCVAVLSLSDALLHLMYMIMIIIQSLYKYFGYTIAVTCSVRYCCSMLLFVCAEASSVTLFHCTLCCLYGGMAINPLLNLLKNIFSCPFCKQIEHWKEGSPFKYLCLQFHC